MTARKGASKAAASNPQDAAAAGPDPDQHAAPPKVVTEPDKDPELDPALEATPESGEVVSETGVPPGPEVPPQIRQPIQRYQVERPEPFRAGGHVLTERGWEIDPDAQLGTEQPAADQRSADQRDTEQEH